MGEAKQRWWWVRHAPVTANNGRLYGQMDLPCDTADAAAFAGLARILPSEAAWIVTPLRRTHQTAAAIVAAGLRGPAEIPGPRVAVEPELAEQHFGDWQGRTYAELAESGTAYHRFWLTPALSRPPGGESFVELMARVAVAIERIGRQTRAENIICVAHGGTIRAALAHALGLTPEAALGCAVQNLSVTRLDHYASGTTEHGHGWSVGFVNRPPC
jgi:alpha-ribazole phosphatase